MASLSRISPNDVPQIGGMAASAVASLALTFMPSEALDRLVELCGFVAAAPSGTFRRAVLVLLAGNAVAAVVWAALFLVVRSRRVSAGAGGIGTPEVRSADAHPDAPTRRPLTVAEFATRDADGEDDGLGPTRDLDQPLAASDSDAIPHSPREAVRPVAPPGARVEPLRPGERIESFEISERYAAETGAPSVEALFARLERRIAARSPELRRAG